VAEMMYFILHLVFSSGVHKTSAAFFATPINVMHHVWN
jgi:hypothetical protein